MTINGNGSTALTDILNHDALSKWWGSGQWQECINSDYI